MPAATIQQAPAAANVSAGSLAIQIFPQAANPALAVSVAAPGKLTLEGRRFKVRASGKATTIAATTTALVILYAQNTYPAAPLVPANWKAIATGTARVINTTTAAWWIEADLVFDSISGTVAGTFTDMMNSLTDPSAAIANAPTGINATNLTVTQGGSPVAPQDPVLFFTAALQFGVSGAGNIGILSALVVDF